METFADEESFYARLGLQYIPPELREGLAEVERAREGSLPTLVAMEDIKGDLHVHTNWSDGRDSSEAMLRAARERGYQYVAITDHSVGRGNANGLNEERLRAHIRELRELEGQVGIRVLVGSEVDIRADGSLDYPDSILEDLDLVVASVHTAMGQDRDTITGRIIKAMHNPRVDIIGHLTTRLLGQRDPIDVDVEAVFQAALETGTALEINASPERLDLKDTHVLRARELGVPLVISTDSHETGSLAQIRYGVAVARRGWCEPHHILNTRPLEEFLAFFRQREMTRAG
jgi:DNA polymerase (family 10)